MVDTVAWLRTQTELPICVGFGISGPDQVRQLAPVADGLIVGSAIVRRLSQAINRPRAEVVREIGQFVAELAEALSDSRRLRRPWTSRSRPSIEDTPARKVRELDRAQDVIPLEPCRVPVEPFCGARSRLDRDLALSVKASLGLWAPHIPRELGGLGLNCVEYALVGEELGRSPLGPLRLQRPGARRRQHGNPPRVRHAAQQERWLVPLVQGEIRSCFAMTEPDHPGSNPVWMGTTAVRDGDDYVLERPQVVCLGGRRIAASRS